MSILVLPVGSYEQHGAHLPPDTDTIVATHFARELVEMFAGLELGPAITISSSGEHNGFPNTLSIGNDALTKMLTEVIRSADWCDGVILINGHGGNLRAIDHAVEIAKSEGRKVLAWSPRLPEGDAHAGFSETSLMLAIDPDSVRMICAEMGNTESLTRLMPAIIKGGIQSVSANGVLGDPTLAHVAAGREILNGLMIDAASAVANWLA